MSARAATNSPARLLRDTIGAALFFLVGPGTLAAYVPRGLTGWRMRPPLLGLVAGRWLGMLLVAAGAFAVVECFVRFVARGWGTPAPVAPPRRLVVSGLYARVRNPMYVGIVTAIVGQALWLGSTRLLEYAGIVWLGFIVWVTLYEEPRLQRAFGREYTAYRAHVPRWVPRLRAWRPPEPGPNHRPI